MLLVAAFVVTDASPGSAQYPGNNGLIAFARGSSGVDHIFVVDDSGANLRRLTDTAADYADIDWSADGSRIAFVKMAGDTGEVWIMSASGSGAARVSAPGADRRNPSWSPDGRSLAVDDDDGTIYSIDVSSGAETVIKEPEDAATYCDGAYTVKRYFSHPQWSPLGDRIAVVASQEGHPGVDCDPNPNVAGDIATIPSAGGDVSYVTDDNRFDHLPDFSPDGSQIVFQRGGGGIAVAPVTGGGFTEISPGSGGRPRWSPDGELILFTWDEDEDGRLDLWTMNADGSDRRLLLQDGLSNGQADWQPLAGCILPTAATSSSSARSAAAANCPFIVNSTADRPDKRPGNKRCDTGRTIAGGAAECTLRAAIQEVEKRSGKDTILFDVPGAAPHVIQPGSSLPEMKQPIVIDATGQPGFDPDVGRPAVELRGVKGVTTGLSIGAGSSTVRGLSVNGFASGLVTSGNGTVIERNYIGLTPGGVVRRNREAGVFVFGGTTEIRDNVISGNVYGIRAVQATLTVADNLIGTDPAGTTRLANRAGIFASGSTSTISGNLMAGNAPAPSTPSSLEEPVGDVFLHEGSDSTITGNRIGFLADDRLSYSDHKDAWGIHLRDSNGVVIGGTNVAERNLVANGVLLNGHARGTKVFGNYIGMTADGMDAGRRPLKILGAHSNTIGGTAPGQGNLLRSVTIQRIDRIEPAARNSVKGNRIGMRADGGSFHDSAVHRSGAGVMVAGANETIVSGNEIAFFEVGVWIEASDTRVLSNRIHDNGYPGARTPSNPVGVWVRSGQRNAIRRNNIWNTLSGLGIDIGPFAYPDGVTKNDNDPHYDSDTGPNDLQNFPILGSATISGAGMTVSGSLITKGGRTYTVDLFSTSDCDTDDLPPPPNFGAYGEGERYLGSVEVRVGSSGRGTLTATYPSAEMAGAGITATATDPDGNTSEFSNCVAVL